MRADVKKHRTYLMAARALLRYTDQNKTILQVTEGKEKHGWKR